MTIPNPSADYAGLIGELVAAAKDRDNADYTRLACELAADTIRSQGTEIKRLRNLVAFETCNVANGLARELNERDRADAAEMGRVDAWQPIDTAPRDDSLFLAATADGRMMIWNGRLLRTALAERTPNHLQFPATHWMPLPAPPQSKD